MKLRAYAKINLLLDVLSKFKNGYHNLFMIMQSVDLYDEVEVLTGTDGKIRIECDCDGIPLNESNTAFKAAESFFRFTGKENPGLVIRIKKNIPHAAGLAGGSADAAAVIRALEKLFSVELSYTDLVKIGLEVGADVPFCLIGGTCLAQHIGGVLSPLPPLPECYTVIVMPENSVETKGAYASYDSISAWARHPDNFGMLQAVLDENLDRICALCYNVFEQAVEVCGRAYIKGIMRENNALTACMSGSGPSVFGIFKNENDAKNACEAFKEKGETAFFCKPCREGVKIVDE